MNRLAEKPRRGAVWASHPLNEFMEGEPPDLDRARAAAARIDKYGNRATEIIDRIRSLCKKSPTQRELVDLNGIIEELLTLVKCEADRYSITIRSELCAELPTITADRVQLQQAFMNLMLYGIEAMKDSGGKLYGEVVAPRPSLALAHNRPPCASTMERLMANPIPPPWLRGDTRVGLPDRKQ